MIRDVESKRHFRAVNFTGGNIGEVYKLNRGNPIPGNLLPGMWAVTDGIHTNYYKDEDFRKIYGLVDETIYMSLGDS